MVITSHPIAILYCYISWIHALNHIITFFFFLFRKFITIGCAKQLEKMMGSKQHLTNILDKFAANIAIQQQTGKEFRSQRDLDLSAEQSFMCAIYGIVDCTDISVINNLSQYIDQDTGCTQLENFYDEKSLDDKLPKRTKRRDRMLGKYQYFI